MGGGGEGGVLPTHPCCNVGGGGETPKPPNVNVGWVGSGERGAVLVPPPCFRLNT